MFVMHDLELRGRALELIAAGVNDCEIGRRLGVARTTVRHWRWAKERDAPARNLCWRCWQPTRRVAPAPADYAELLGLFPQHGPGKKHERPIELEPWQYALVGAAPWAFVRGCIRSDGCSFVNRTGRYAYLSYEFRNWSTDILGIFASTCAAVGLRPRQYRDRVRLCRRADVAQLVTHVGVKS
jgi:hypothetical protein